MGTICVLIACSDGAVVATDSQSQFWRGVDVKRLDANKIYTIGEKHVLAGAGTSAQILTEVNTIRMAIATQEKAQRSHLNKDELEEVVLQSLLALHGKHNIQRSRQLGVEEPSFFNPILVFAGRTFEEDGTVGYLKGILHVEGIVEPVDTYGAIGSGAAYAELLLKNAYYPEITIGEAMLLAALVVVEVGSIDPNCGGDTSIATVRTEKAAILPRAQTVEILGRTEALIRSCWGNLKRELKATGGKKGNARGAKATT